MATLMTNVWRCSIVLAALIVLVKAECTGIELLVDGIPFNNDMLYKPLGSSGTFVGCRECSTGVTPSWFKSDAKISSCGDGGNRSMICVDSRNNNIDLQFLFFLHSHRGSYTCSKYGDHKTLTIDVLDSPTITIHPTSLLTASGVSGTLNCEGAGKGLVMYQWETSNVNGGPWMKIGDSKRLVVRSFEQPRQYRCMVTNEAGTVRSSIATVTTLKTTTQPVSPVTALENIVLVCSSSVADDLKYSWYRVNGSIPYKSKGRNSNTLVIPRALPYDEGVYYCRASKVGVSVESNKVAVRVNDQLTISIMPRNLVTSKGKTVQFIATANGISKSHFIYQWKKKHSTSLPNKVMGVNEAVLTIPSILESDEGQYYCIVTNEWDRSVSSNDVTLTVYGSLSIRSLSNITSPPTIITHPASQLVTVRMTFTLNCEATGEGSITYQWETRNINGGQWVDSSNNSSTLVVSNLRDPQQYRCIVSNEVGSTVSNVATITVLKIINLPHLNDRGVLRDVNGSITFTCTSSVSTNVKFSWAHNGRPITRPNTQSTVGSISTLRITGIRNSDDGRYVCTVTSGLVSVTAHVKTLNVYGAPEISIYPKARDIRKGRSITYQCRVSGLEPLTFLWEKSSGSTWTTVKSGSKLYTTNASLDIGQYVYRCKVSNRGGPVVSNNITVNVYGPPDITSHPSSQLTTINMSVTLNCVEVGKGTIKYLWEISNNNGGPWTKISNSNGRSLVVRNLSQSRHYRCVVSNDAGRTTSNVATITVLKITTHPQDVQQATHGSTVSFSCTSSLSSNVIFSWTHNGRYINGSSTTTGDTSILTITSVRQSDAGSYVCTVRSGSLSVMSNTATLTVYSPPVVTHHPKSSDVPLSGSISLTCEAIGIGTLAYSWERSSGSNWTTVSNDNTTSYTTNTTLAIGQYMYRCRVSSEAGSVVSNIANVNVYGPPAIKTQLTDKLIIFNTTTTLTCTADGDGIITYQWHKRKSVERSPWVMISNNNSGVFVTERLKDSSEFRCTVSNEAGHSRSHATITVLKITTHPEDKLVTVNSTVSFSCTSSLSSNVIFSWTHNGRSINGSSTTGDTSILTITSVRHNDAGSYVCTVRSGSLSVMSNTAILTVYGPPVVTDHPGSSDVPLRGSVTLRCNATAVGTLVYSWERSSGGSWTTVSNDNTTSYTTDTTLAIGQYMYRCRVSNEAGSVASNVATVNVYGLPVVTDHPESSDVPLRGSITLTCEAIGIGTLAYFWERTNSGSSWTIVSNDNTTSYTTNTTLAIGQYMYRCRVSNEAGSVVSNIATVNVYGPPAIKTQLTDKLIIFNTTTTLTCTADGDGIITYQWHKRNSVEKSPWVMISNNNNSVFMTKRLQDSSEFRCTVSNEAGHSRSRATITVLKITTHPEDKLVTVNSTVSFSCTSSLSFNVIFSWTHNGTFINGSSTTTGDTSILTITSVRHDDAGSYVCTVRSGSLSVMSNTATLTVYYGLPVVIHHPTSTNVSLIGSVTLMCTASGIGTLAYSWERSSGSNWTTVSNDNTTSYTTNTTLAIGQYMYRCRVSNEAGSVVSNIATVNVYGPPVVAVHPKSSDVPLRRSITLSCRASGIGTLAYSWETSSGSNWTTVSNDNTTSYTTDTTLAIGQYMYRCRVSNEAGSVVSNITTVNVYGPPVVTDHPESSDVPLRGSITLTCEASGMGTLVYSWERSSGGNWTTVSNDNTTSYTTDTTLAIGQYMYRCRVSNEAGSVVSNIATVNVYGPPTIMTHPTNHWVLAGKNTTLTCEGTGKGSIAYQWESSTIKEEHWMSISNNNSTRFDLQNLQRSHQYRCVVSNEAGRTSSNPAIITVLKRSSPPKNLTITDVSVNSFQLIWFAPSHPHGTIDHYIVRYNQFELIINITNFNGTYTVGNLSPYTEYNINVTAVKIIGATGESLKGEDSPVVTERTLAGEPIVTALLQRTENELLLNHAHFNAETFTIDMPVISTQNGPFSHLYIIVALSDHVITGIVNVSTQELLQQSMNMFPLFYITAVVNASQFVPDHRMRYILGAGDNTTDAEGHVFHNREVKIDFTYLFRVFSINSTSENEISTTSDTQKILAQPQNSSSSNSDGTNFSSLIIAVLAALLLALIIYAIVMSVWVFKTRRQKQPHSREDTDDDNGHSIALEPTHKCVTVSQPDNDELENPIYSSVTYKDMENPAHSSITNTEDLENQASVTNEEIENPAYVVIGKEDIENPAYTSVTTDRYSSAHHYETIPYQTIAKQ